MLIFAQQTDRQMKKILLEQLPRIVAEGKREAEQILEGLSRKMVSGTVLSSYKPSASIAAP